MKNVKRLSAAIVLSCMLGVPAFADCPPLAPGETHSPPCTSAPTSTDDLIAPEQTETPPAPEEVELITVVELALDLLLLY
jgi:hypothetical protein